MNFFLELIYAQVISLEFFSVDPSIDSSVGGDVLLSGVSASNQIFTGRLSTAFSFFNFTKRDSICFSSSSLSCLYAGNQMEGTKRERERQLPIPKYAGRQFPCSLATNMH
uniref:Uncharacterized protein n=1 Tax=Lactuca sativa TaxID=4236 RepID=A0A9R1VLH4_LACSA|nr:hypothetical protein LSAT_V11C500279640 [Lactuca sativa]